MFFIEKKKGFQLRRENAENVHLVDMLSGLFFRPAARGEMHNLFISNNTGRTSLL